MTSDNPYPKLRQFVIAKPRAFGLIALLFSGAMFYLFILLPVQEVMAGKQSVVIEMKGIVLLLPTFLLGLGFVIFGTKCRKIFIPDQGKRPKLSIAIFILLIAIGLGGLYVFRMFLNQYGYDL